MIDGFSVLMSVYCKETAAHLNLALRSILVEQTKHPDELVLVCDGPLTPELDVVIEKYETDFPETLKVFRRKQNEGLGNALNFGLKQCSYPLVARADSDDICCEDRFEVQVAFMEQHPEVSIISAYIDEFDEDWTKPISVKKLPVEHEKIVKRAKMRNPLNHMAVMFRKKDVLEVGSYRHMPYVEDYDLWLRAIAHGKILGNIDRILVHARVGNGMVYRRGNKAQIKSWSILNDYMIQERMIWPIRKVQNMIMIRSFVYMPPCLKKIAYKTFLRKNGATHGT